MTRTAEIAALEAAYGACADAGEALVIADRLHRLYAAQPKRSLFQEAHDSLIAAGWVPNPALYTVVDGLYSTRKPYQD